MVYVYEFISPDCDLDGESFEVQALSRAEADGRADDRMTYTFALSSPERKAKTSVRLIGTKKSKTAPMVAA